jgi:hypothetical protein
VDAILKKLRPENQRPGNRRLKTGGKAFGGIDLA